MTLGRIVDSSLPAAQMARRHRSDCSFTSEYNESQGEESKKPRWDIFSAVWAFHTELGNCCQGEQVARCEGDDGKACESVVSDRLS